MSFSHTSAQKPLPSPKTFHSVASLQTRESWAVPEEAAPRRAAPELQLLSRAQTFDMPRKATMANQVPITLRRDDKNPLTQSSRLAATLSAHSLDTSFERAFQDNLELRLRISTLENKIRNRKLLRILLQKREQEIEHLRAALAKTLADTDLLQDRLKKVLGHPSSPAPDEEVIIDVQSEQEETLVTKAEVRSWQDPMPRLSLQMDSLKWKLVKFLARRDTQRT